MPEEDVGVCFLQISYFLFGVVAPLLQLVSAAVLYYQWHDQRPSQYQLSRGAAWVWVLRVSRSWSALEVFLVSLLAAQLQMHTFAAFLIGSNQCDGPIVLMARSLLSPTSLPLYQHRPQYRGSTVSRVMMGDAVDSQCLDVTTILESVSEGNAKGLGYDISNLEL